MAKRYHDRKAGKLAIHMASAWSVENRVVLGQLSTQEKSNEITAIPELLEALEISGCVVTIDAMGCQRTIAQAILDKAADYVLALKGNQDHIHHDTQQYFHLHDNETSQSSKTERNRNREETRACTVIKAPAAMIEEYKWPGLSSLCRITSERTLDDTVSKETRYYLSSLGVDAKTHSELIRAHWGVENPLHWVLDVAFNEDSCRVREKNSAENFSILRRMALNLIRQDKSSKTGVKGKRLRVGWDPGYLEKLRGDKIALYDCPDSLPLARVDGVSCMN